MTKKRLIQMGFIIFKRMQEPYYQGVAAELAFFFLLSIVPIAILLAQVLGIFSISIDFMKNVVEQYVAPDMADGLIGSLNTLDYRSSGSFNVLFIVFAVWAASKAQYALMRIANYSYGQPDGRGYIKERLRAIKTLVLTLFMLCFGLIILVYGELIVHAFSFYLQEFLKVTPDFSDAWYFIRWPVGIAVYFVAVSFNYYILPTYKIPYRQLMPGSIFASLGMLLATWAYSYYTSVFANYDLLYGSLASIVALLFWFFILGYVLVLGIEFNVAWSKTARPDMEED